jgi:hypothetical protein
MGSFIVNVNVRATHRQAVEKEIKAFNPAAAWVTGAKNGWITIYEEGASTQDENRIRELTEHVSSGLKSPAIAFLVHDSDFLCYWLFDDGQLIDEFNSCPDYFDEGENEEALAGKPEVILKYCPPGTKLSDVEQVLSDKGQVFADSQLAQLAELLGIDSTRSCVDFRDIGSEIQPEELEAVFVGTQKPGYGAREPWQPQASPLRLHDDFDDEGEGDDEGESEQRGRGPMARMPMGPSADILKMLGLGGKAGPADPLVQQLVDAAAANNVAEIDRLVSAGAAIQGMAPLKQKKPAEALPLGARMLGGAGLALPVTPLLAALASKQIDAARRLIELGADVKVQHPLLGTPVHIAAGSGDAELLRLVLDAGGDPKAVNAQNHTPLQAMQQLRQMVDQIAKLGPLGAMFGKNLKSQFEKIMPSAQDLDACEQLLRERGG